ncbi:hypothetical protein [Nocardia amamiensis]|uniref:hypothetical protein n=1 Tax=Nocardia amamiensis TaxID=404578 RepID=UPI0012F4C6CF|nr:hypothetical protein [Nocardia amamiensis]
MLGTVAAVVWLARPSAPACGASHEAASTSRSPVVAVTFAPVVSGDARHYELVPAVSCSLGDFSADGPHAGVSTSHDGRADQCAAYLDLEPEQVPALVVGSCSECAAGQRDPNAATFVPVAGSADGVVRVRYRLVRGSQPAPDQTYEPAPDSSASWFAVLFGGTENGGR